MIEIPNLAFGSILAYEPLLKNKMEQYRIKSFKYAYLHATKRSPERYKIINDIEIMLERIFEILNNVNYDTHLREYAREVMEKINKDYDRLKKIKITENRIKDFEEKLNKIKEQILLINEIYPLSTCIALVLDIYPDMIKLDYKLLQSTKKHDYLRISEKGFKQLPEKVIIFHTPIIALYLAFGGYERMNIMQLARLTGFFHKFVHFVFKLQGGVAKLGDDFRKVPLLAER